MTWHVLNLNGSRKTNCVTAIERRRFQGHDSLFMEIRVKEKGALQAGCANLFNLCNLYSDYSLQS